MIICIKSKAVISKTSIEGAYIHEVTPLRDGNLIVTTQFFSSASYLLEPHEKAKLGYHRERLKLNLNFQTSGYPHNGFLQLRDNRFVSGTKEGTLKIYKLKDTQ